MSFLFGLLVGGVICGLAGAWLGVSLSADEVQALRIEAWNAKIDRSRMRGELVKAKNALRRARDKSPLPDEPDDEAIERLLMKTVARYHNLHTPT